MAKRMTALMPSRAADSDGSPRGEHSARIMLLPRPADGPHRPVYCMYLATRRQRDSYSLPIYSDLRTVG